MSKEDKKAENSNQQGPVEVELKDPWLAAFLAWLLPGLGHFYQGRFAKGVLFFVCIMGTFGYGLYLGSGPDVGVGRVVYWAWQPDDKRLYYFCQAGVGLPALPALVQSFRVKNGNTPFGTFMAPPRSSGDNLDFRHATLSDLHRRLGRFFELGTIYTSIAGLLNILAIFDALAGPVAPEVRRKEDEEEGKEKDKEKEKESGVAGGADPK